MNFCKLSLLSFINRVNHPGVSLVCLPYLKKLFGKDSREIYQLIESPVWEARWVATQKITQHYPVKKSRELLYDLAQDSTRNVREGATHGLGFLLAESPEVQNDYKKALTRPEFSENIRRAVLYSAVVLWRKFPQKINLAIELLTVGASEPPKGCFRTIGSNLLANELMKSRPELAQDLLEKWSTSTNKNLQYHAERGMPKKINTFKSKEMFSNWTNTSQINVPANLFDQVIGQEKAVDIVRLAVKQGRFVMLIGDPGTGKSLLAKAMAEKYYASHKLQDVLAMPNLEASSNPHIKILPAGEGGETVKFILENHNGTKRTFNFLWWVVFIGIVIVGSVLSYIHKTLLYPTITIIITSSLLWVKKRLIFNKQNLMPHLLVSHSKRCQKNFIDATGFQSAALLGDVRHDPFQSGGRETPAHLLLVPGAIHMAHKGILFIDEMNSLSMENQQQLLTAIQEKKFPIMGRSIGSSGSMVRSQPVPCDFILCLAGNKEDVKKLHPALISRMDGFGYTIIMRNEMEDTEFNRQKIAQFIAQEVINDGKISHFSREAVDSVIKQAIFMSGNNECISLRLREVGGIVRRSGDVASLENSEFVKSCHVETALKI